MPFKLTIELSDRDLRHFRRELQRTRQSVSIADDDEILSAAADSLQRMRAADVPDFVTARLVKLQTLLDMLTDTDWPMDDAERSPVLAALAYLCDPEDVIPDEIPGIGLLDDAVMIELVFRELRHELEAYEDFRTFRQDVVPARARTRSSEIGERLERRRRQLVERMVRRRREESVLLAR
jgi:uncharacterized membrane protein YkvA (DUF1232 family)